MPFAPQHKEERIDNCFNQNITAVEPPPPNPARLAPPKSRSAPSYSQPTKASSSAQAVGEMQGHLMRRGKRMTQLFMCANGPS